MPIPDVIDLFLATAAAQPSHLALSVHDETLTYAAFEDRVRRYAGAFTRRDSAGVLVALPQGPDAYAAMLGAGLAGCYYAPLNVQIPLEKQKHIVGLMQPDWIVAEAALAAQLIPEAPGASGTSCSANADSATIQSGCISPAMRFCFSSGTWTLSGA